MTDDLRANLTIQTKFILPTSSYGARLSVSCAGNIVLPWDYSESKGRNHAHAAEVLAAKLGWPKHWANDELADGSFSHVHIPTRHWDY